MPSLWACRATVATGPGPNEEVEVPSGAGARNHGGRGTTCWLNARRVAGTLRAWRKTLASGGRHCMSVSRPPASLFGRCESPENRNSTGIPAALWKIETPLLHNSLSRCIKHEDQLGTSYALRGPGQQPESSRVSFRSCIGLWRGIACVPLLADLGIVANQSGWRWNVRRRHAAFDPR